MGATEASYTVQEMLDGSFKRWTATASQLRLMASRGALGGDGAGVIPRVVYTDTKVAKASTALVTKPSSQSALPSATWVSDGTCCFRKVRVDVGKNPVDRRGAQAMSGGAVAAGEQSAVRNTLVCRRCLGDLLSIAR